MDHAPHPVHTFTPFSCWTCSNLAESCITMNLTLTMSLASTQNVAKPHLGLYTPEQQVLCQGSKTRSEVRISGPETPPRVCALCGACSFPGLVFHWPFLFVYNLYRKQHP